MKELLRGVFMYYTNACSGDTKGEIWYTLVQCQYFLITPVSFFLFKFFFYTWYTEAEGFVFQKHHSAAFVSKTKILLLQYTIRSFIYSHFFASLSYVW